MCTSVVQDAMDMEIKLALHHYPPNPILCHPSFHQAFVSKVVTELFHYFHFASSDVCQTVTGRKFLLNKALPCTFLSCFQSKECHTALTVKQTVRQC